MPTESHEFGPGELLYKDYEGIIKELCSYQYKEENDDYAADATRYAFICEAMYEEAYKIYDFKYSGKKDYVPSKEQLEELKNWYDVPTENF